MRTRTFLFARTTALTAPRAIFSEGRVTYINQLARTFLASFSQIEICMPDRSKKRLSSSEILLYLWSLVKNRQDNWHNRIHYSWNRENHVLNDKADKDYLLRLFWYKHSIIIFSWSDSTSPMISNDHILSLKMSRLESRPRAPPSSSCSI